MSLCPHFPPLFLFGQYELKGAYPNFPGMGGIPNLNSNFFLFRLTSKIQLHAPTIFVSYSKQNKTYNRNVYPIVTSLGYKITFLCATTQQPSHSAKHTRRICQPMPDELTDQQILHLQKI